jgi:hypothetical protein
MGRLAEAEDGAQIYRDLRMKISIDPNEMKVRYQKGRVCQVVEKFSTSSSGILM